VSTSSSSGSLSLTALGTGIDWQTIVSQLTQVSEQALTPYNNEISAYNSQISAWGTITSDLSTLQTAADTLASPTALELYTANVSSNSSTSGSSLLTATASSSANPGSYSVVINSVAQAAQLASGDFSSQSSALNVSGNILVNNRAVSISSTDTLQNLQTKINALDSGSTPSGVTASIVKDSSSTYRLVLSSDTTGVSGISLLNGDANNTLEALGFNGSGAATVKNQVTGAAQSDALTDTTTAVNTLLGTTAQSGTVTINGKQVTIDLSQGLQAINDALKSAGLSSSIVSSTSGTTTSGTTSSNTTTKYSLQIAGGINSFTDSNNVLQTLGFVQGNRTSEVGVTGGAANTTDGSSPITASTLISGIYGYNNWTSGDTITLSGTDHSGSSVSSNFTINQGSTVQDLLDQIDSTFGNVTASVNTNGQIQVVDNATGTSQLSLSLAPQIQDGNSSLGFGSFGTVGTVRQYVLQQGTNASFTVDGMNMTSSSNTVTNAISGVTLNLLGASPSTTLTLNVNHDTSGIEKEINSMISAYNNVISDINTQNNYNTATNTTGGPLFGNSSLNGLKAQLANTILNRNSSSSYSSLPTVGIKIGSDGLLSMDSSSFEAALSSNFQDVANLFQNSATSSNSLFNYVYSSSSTKSGTYDVSLTSSSEGTIDGQTAKVNGNLWSLSGSTSGAKGLGLTYTGSTFPASTSITVSRGIGSLLSDLVDTYTNSVSGIITSQNSGINNSITGLQKQVSDMQDNINQQMDTLTKEYQNMNTLVAQLDQMQSYLSTQLADL
jgi:flagellar hook-associated protein 2